MSLQALMRNQRSRPLRVKCPKDCGWKGEVPLGQIGSMGMKIKRHEQECEK